MIKEQRVGISFTDEKTQVALVEFRPDGADLKLLEEFPRPADQPLTLLPDGILNLIRSSGKLTKLNVSIETGNAYLQQFPVDMTLSPAEQDEQYDWEWKNYIPDYSSSEYARETRVLKTNDTEQTRIVLSILLKQTLLNEIRETFQRYKLQLDRIDLQLRSSENVVSLVHPEVNERNVALVGISPMRLDVSVLENGKLIAYKYGLSFQPQTAVDFLAGELLEYLPEALYVYGSAVSYEWLKALRSSLGVVIPLNPFRKFRIMPEVKNFSKYLGYEHRFCGCIGSIIE